MIFLLIITSVLVLLSFIVDKKKTYDGIKIALKKLINILMPIILVLILVSLILFFIPESIISKYLSNGNKYISVLIATFIGSITMMPGFIAFPLAGILKQNGVSFMVISAFTTTLMMVGILTFPVEKAYFGTRVALLRNVLSLFIAVIVAITTGILFGEVFK